MPSFDKVAAVEVVSLRWTFGQIALDEGAMVLSIDNAKVIIEPKPLQLLMYLLRRCNEVVTREELLGALWPGRVVTDGVISNCVAKLRAALGDGDQTLIATVARYGYRLNAQVQVEQIKRKAPTGEQLGLTPGADVPHREGARLVRPLSDRGQAEVWLASLEDKQTQRAFKFARDADELIFLKREITLNRILTDTNGDKGRHVRVLSWNLEKPPFYLETEYFACGNLQEWSQSQGGLEALSLAMRIDLARQCAVAVTEAHSAGVLHKDLKPSNFLIEINAAGEAVVRLGDFGAGAPLEANLFDQLSITRLGFTQDDANLENGGTPLYIAPELMAGHSPTVQSDVYALGMLLYQLVIGDFRRILASGWESQVADPLLCEDIAVAAHGDPEQRLSAASQLAERLATLDQRRAEQQRLAQVQADAEIQRLALARSLARRGLLQAITATMFLGLLVAALLYVEARKARDDAVAQAETTQAVVSFLTDDLLSFANPRGQGDGDVRVRDLLHDAQKTLDNRFVDRPLVRARLQVTIGSAFGSLGQHQDAENNLLPAIATLAATLGDTHPETQAARLALRDTHRIAHRFDQFLPLASTIKAAEESAGRARSPVWFEGAWSQIYGECHQVARSLWFDDCGRRLQPLLDQARAVLGDDHPVTVRLMWIRATLSLLVGRHEGMEPLLAESHRRMSQQLGPDHPRVTEVRMFWAWAHLGQGDALRAEHMLRETLASFGESVGEQHDFAFAAQFHLARALLAQGRHAEAEPLFRGSWVWRRDTLGLNSFVTANALGGLTRTLLALGRVDEAVALADQAAQQLSPQHPDDGVVSLHYDLNLAAALARQGDAARRGAVLERTERNARQWLTQGQWTLGRILVERGRWFAENGDQQTARSLLEEGLSILRAARGQDDVFTRQALQALDQLGA